MFMAFALCFAGFVSAAHAGLNSDHSLHDAHVKHECTALVVSKVDSKDTGKVTSDSGFCEAACHASLMLNLTPVMIEKIAMVENSSFPFANDALVSNLAATPDQPPKLS